MSGAPRIEVAIALVFRAGRLLVTRRPANVHLGGSWELPGGKIRANESAEACAVREVSEETHIAVVARGRRAVIEWDYPERSVALYPVECDWIHGDGELVEVADLVWATKADLAARTFPPANAELIAELCTSARLL